MSDPSSFSAGPNRLDPRRPGSSGGAIGPRPAARPGEGPADGERPRARSGGTRRDPFDVDGAMARLKTLLAFDGGRGPRDGVPRRGFYLNILT